METVYDNGGECLGDEYVNLGGLQQSTRDAIQQMIYLDKMVDEMGDDLANITGQTLSIVDSCFHAYASSYRDEAKEMAQDLLNDRANRHE